MGGSISADSEFGRGSVFTVELPLDLVADAQSGSSAGRAAARAQAPSASVRVLAAEDNAVNQLVLRTLLGQVGVEVTVVENGLQALEAWRRESWDVILMDVQMPVMDGLTATAEIRRSEAETARVRTPIVALTANAMSHQVAEYLAADMDAHVAKPIEAQKLFEALEGVLEQSEEQEGSSAAVEG
jgi:CheY-like chemotaxis protein